MMIVESQKVFFLIFFSNVCCDFCRVVPKGQLSSLCIFYPDVSMGFYNAYFGIDLRDKCSDERV